MAEQFHLDKSIVEIVDETSSSSMVELFGKSISQRVVTQYQFLSRSANCSRVLPAERSARLRWPGAPVLPAARSGLTVQFIAPLNISWNASCDVKGST